MTDARKLWTAGSRAPAEVPVAEIVERAESFRRKVRSSHTAEYLAGVFVVGFFGLGAAVPDAIGRLSPMSRIGAAAIAGACVFVMTYLAVKGSPGEVRRDEATLACYRGELVRRRDLLASVTLWYLAPFWPGMALFLWGVPADSPGARAVLGAVAAAMVGTNLAIALLNRRAAAKLTREIEALPTEVRGPGLS